MAPCLMSTKPTAIVGLAEYLLLLVYIHQLILPRSEANLLGIVDDVSAVLAVDALLQRL